MRGSYKRSRRTVPPVTPAGDWSDPKPVIQYPLKTFNIYEALADPEKEKLRSIRLSGIRPPLPKPRPSFMTENQIEFNALKKKIRRGEPLLTVKQIRRIENPFYMSVILELDAMGYPQSSEYIQELNNIDCDMHEYENVETPFLHDSRDVLKVLCIGLKKAENASQNGDRETEAMSILDLARHFSADSMSDWYWLATELFQRSVSIIDRYIGDHGENEGIIRYLFAKFLFEKQNQLNDAESHLMITMSLSEGKTWNLTEILQTKQDYLYFESCYLLHKILTKKAIKLRNKNPINAIELCRRAVLHIDETQRHPEMEKAMFQLILSYEAANDLQHALALLENYMAACKEHGETEDLCHGHLMLANCYKRLKNTWMAKQSLEEVTRIAELNNLTAMKATAHSKMVQYFLGEMQPKELVDHAVVAYEKYAQLSMPKHLEEMRCLVGISTAQAMMPHYTTLLLSSENVDSTQFNTFMNWKTIRKPFVPGTVLIQPQSDILNMAKPRMDQIREEEQEYYRLHALYDQMKEPRQTLKASVVTHTTTSDNKSNKSQYSVTQSSIRTWS